jgi:hypothetical protein
MEQAPKAPGVAPGAEPLEWQFLQCFGERTPGEEVQEGERGARKPGAKR